MTQGQRNAIVTGAGSGLGREISRQLARRGWHVALADVDLAGAEQTCSLIADEGGEAPTAGGSSHVERLDVSDPDQWRELRDRLEQAWDHLDLLVNNAGVAGSGECGNFPLDDWHWLMSINLYGGIYGCHTMVDWLKANPRGAHIINTCSFAAFASAPAMAAYNVAKAGMVSLSETLYAELRPHGVGVTAVCPVFFATNLLTRGRFETEAHRRIAVDYSRKAPFTVEDVAAAALRAMDRKRLYVVMGRKGLWYWRVKRWFPRFFMYIVSGGYGRKIAAEMDQNPIEQSDDKALQPAGSPTVGE